MQTAINLLTIGQTVVLGYSVFCDLFTEQEWKDYVYSNGVLFPYLPVSGSYFPIVDLSFWYSYGPGNPTSAAMGKGYVQELLSRLTQTTIPDADTTTGDSTVTFPLNQPIYVDATHDTASHSILLCRIHPNFRA
jgi:hypothetical protein